MNTPKAENENSSRNDIPNWLAVIIGIVFWIMLLPLVHAGIPWLISSLGSHYGWRDGRPANWNLLGLIPVALATVCLLWLMILHFSRTPKRVTLERTPAYLLVHGPYKFSRNPMYLAELMLWLGWAIYYGSIAVLIGFLLMVLLMNYGAIPREERDLEARFDNAYREYKRKVPRWFGKAEG